ncbi:MAG: adenylate/guanylate cyclase domain-containing protein [Planctomycetes bacterium]|nr:adenylate/guanylate cyclase domain-containing protein [Planctomycetota bacterium]
MKPILLAPLGIALSLGLAATPVGTRLEAIGEDLRFRWRSAPESSDNLLHIDIDDASIERVGRWPWSRVTQGRILRTLGSLGPSAVLVDIEYPDPSGPELRPRAEVEEILADPEGAAFDRLLVDPDAELAGAIWEAECVHLAYHFEDDPKIVDGVWECSSPLPPRAAFVEAARGTGFVDVRGDPFDGVLRKAPLFIRHQGRLVPNLALGYWLDGCDAAFRSACSVRDGVVSVPRRPPLGGMIRIPVDGEGGATIDWADTGSTGETWETHLGPHLPCAALFDLWELRELVVQGMRELHRGIAHRLTEEWLVSYGELQAEHRRAMGERERAACDAAGLALRNRIGEAGGICVRIRGEMAQMLAGGSSAARQVGDALEKVEMCALRERDLTSRLGDLVEGKTCFLGAVYSAGTDFRAIPTRAAFPGVAVHSNLLDMLQKERFVRRFPGWARPVAMIAAGLLAAWAAMRLQVGAGGTLLASCGGAYVGALVFLFGRWAWMGPMAAPLLALGVNYTALTAYRQLTTEKDRRRIRKMFELYLSPSVIMELEKHPEMLQLGGEEREITSYFSDIQSFTPIAEGMSSPELVELLRDYFDRMTHVVLEHHGTLDKYVGDAIVAIWGAPIPQGDHALRAVRTALESQAALAGLREWLRVEGKPPLFMRIGINSGKAVVGNMGSTERFNYTALGDTVNLAARLEGANKPFGTWILIGPGTHAAVRHEIACRRVAHLVVLGRSQPVWAYEPIAPEAGLPPERHAWLDAYHLALDQYVKGDLPLARTMFEGVLAQTPDDGPSLFYRGECARLAGAPLPDGWDGRVVLDVK